MDNKLSVLTYDEKFHSKKKELKKLRIKLKKICIFSKLACDNKRNELMDEIFDIISKEEFSNLLPTYFKENHVSLSWLKAKCKAYIENMDQLLLCEVLINAENKFLTSNLLQQNKKNPSIYLKDGNTQKQAKNTIKLTLILIVVSYPNTLESSTKKDLVSNDSLDSKTNNSAINNNLLIKIRTCC
ncbi:hypothetical protein MXB_3492 [Myxobolus squamalis]|nr:hypothetical protein MXB_3492 [Myxobolus squamalis]